MVPAVPVRLVMVPFVLFRVVIVPDVPVRFVIVPEVLLKVVMVPDVPVKLVIVPDVLFRVVIVPTPVTLASPTTKRADVGFVDPIPRLPET